MLGEVVFNPTSNLKKNLFISSPLKNYAQKQEEFPLHKNLNINYDGHQTKLKSAEPSVITVF